MNWLQAIFRPPPRVEPSLDLAAAADRELERILAFWLEHARDPAGGFWAAWRGRPQRRGERGALLTSRILWTFSTACLRRPDPAFLAMAQWAFADLQTFHDAANGGLVWSRDPKRAQPPDRKEIYGQAFGIYGLSAYVRATGDSKALDQAIALYRLIERYARDHEPGGYFDTLQADWRSPRANGAPGPKSQNTMLHLMEAYAGLLRVWPDPQLRDDLAALITLFCDRIIDPATWHLQLFLTADLRPASDRVSPGHDIECSWLLLDAAAAVGDLQLEQRCRSVAVQMATATVPAIDPTAASLTRSARRASPIHTGPGG